MTPEEKKRLNEKLFVVLHEYRKLEDWEILFLNRISDKMHDDEEISKYELSIVDILSKGEMM